VVYLALTASRLKSGWLAFGSASHFGSSGSHRQKTKKFYPFCCSAMKTAVLSGVALLVVVFIGLGGSVQLQHQLPVFNVKNYGATVS